MTLASYTCSPFHLHYTVGASFPIDCAMLWSNGYTDYYIDYP